MKNQYSPEFLVFEGLLSDVTPQHTPFPLAFPSSHAQFWARPGGHIGAKKGGYSTVGHLLSPSPSPQLCSTLQAAQQRNGESSLQKDFKDVHRLHMSTYKAL